MLTKISRTIKQSAAILENALKIFLKKYNFLTEKFGQNARKEYIENV